MAAKRTELPSRGGPKIGLTDNTTKVVRSEFCDTFKLTEAQRRDLDALLPPGPKGRDHIFRMFEEAAHDYLKARANPTPVRDFRRRLAKLIDKLRADRDALCKLAPGYAEEISSITANIDVLDEKWRDLQYDADFYEGAPFHRRQLVLNLLLLWEACGPEREPGSSRKKDTGEVTGPVIRYLTFACSLVMKRTPDAETLRKDIYAFKELESKLWNPALRRSKKNRRPAK